MDILNLLKKIEQNEILMHEKRAIIAFSGGPDSVFLAKLFIDYFKDIEIVLYHLNHNMRESAMRDEEFVRAFAEENNLKLNINSVKIKVLAKEKQIGLEEAGRVVRYEDLERISQELNINTIMTAHHLNDDIETFFMNFIRGSSLNGYSAIKAREGKYFHPLLEIKKSDIVEYLDESNEKYCIDETNFIPDTMRNIIRIEKIPKLEKLDKNFYEDFRKFLQAQKREYDLQNRLVEAFISEYNISELKDELAFKIEDVKKFFGNDLATLFFHVIKHFNVDMTDVYRSQLIFIDDFPNSNEEKKLNVAGITAIKSFEIIKFIKDERKKAKREIFISDRRTNFTISHFYSDKIKGEIKIRNREPGDKIKLENRPTKVLKKLLIEKKIPAYERDGLYVISDYEGILYVEKIGAAERAKHGNKKIYINERKTYEQST